jgi:hypothetical protein
MAIYVDSGYVNSNYTHDDVSIDWANKIIFVPQSYLTTTANPASFNLDTDVFRLRLKELEASVDGMSYLDTHQHNTEVPLGGVIYARVIEIINGYTITFENGQYAVNLFGSNNNIGDVTNINSVSVRTNNAAGLIVDPGISESLDYGESITYDEVNGTTGTRHPIGTKGFPVNNIPDLQELLTFYKRAQVETIHGVTLTQDFTDISWFCLTANEVFCANGYKTTDCSFRNLILEDDFNHSSITAKDCTLTNVQRVGGIIADSNLTGTLVMSEQFPLTLKHCVSSVPGTDSPIIDMVLGMPTSLNMRDYSGGIQVKNCDVSGDTGTIEFGSGNCTLESSCSGGTLVIRGIANLTDNSTGTAINSRGLIDPENQHTLEFNDKINIQSGSTYSGTLYPIGLDNYPVDNIPDALAIAVTRGIKNLHFHGDWEFTGTTFINNYTVRGDGLQQSEFTFNAGAVMLNCRIENAKVTGDITGIIGFNNCHLYNLGSTNLSPSSQDVIVDNCLMDGTIFLTPAYSGSVKMIDCKSGVPGTNRPTFDVANSYSNFLIRNYTGGMILKNSGQNINTSIDLISGTVEIDPTVSGGTYVIRGIGELTDNSSSGATVISDGLISKETIADSVWNTSATTFTDGTMGDQIRHILKFTGQPWWVSKEGSDSNDGASPANAFLTIGYAISQASGGDIITVKAGTYDEAVDVNKRGLELYGEIGAIVTNTASGSCVTVSEDYCRVKLIIAKPELGQAGFDIDSVGSAINDCLVSSGGTGMIIQSGTTGTIVTDFRIDEGVTDAGLDIKGNHNEFSDVTIHGGGLTSRAIYLSESYSDDNEFNNCVIWNSTTYDIDIVSGASDNYFHSCGYITKNDLGTDNTFTSLSVSGGSGNCDADAIADAIWDELLASHQNGGSFGEVMQLLLNKADTAQHNLNVQTEMLKNKPNNC